MDKVLIERVVIKNFKSIKDLELDLRPINILVGANGAGKSNFISFFKLINQIYEQKLQHYISNNIDGLLYFGRKTSTEIFGLLDFKNTNAIYFHLKPELSGNGGLIASLGDYFNNSADTEKQYAERWNNKVWDTNTKESSIRNKTYRAKYINLCLANFRVYHFHDTGQNSPMKRSGKVKDNDRLRENGENLAAFLYYLQQKHPENFEKIERNIQSVAPFFDRFNLVPERLDETQIELRWLEKGSSSDDYFNAYSLSDGTLRFIALTTLLLQPDLPETIIIDEPELGLHPFAVNKLAAMMKQAAVKGSQVIVSTQSVGLVDNFEPESVVAVDRKGNQSIFKRLDSTELKDWLEEYTLGELWNKNVFGARP